MPTAIGLGISQVFGMGGVADTWTPLDATSATLLGLWNFNDLASCYIERDYSGGTTPCEYSDNIGTCRDTSGNDRHIVAPSTGQRAVANAGGYAAHDGVDDGYGTQAVMPDTAHLYLVASYGPDSASVIVYDVSLTKFIVFQDNNGGSPLSDCGTPTGYKDGASMDLTSRDTLHSAMADGSAHVYDFRDLDTSAWGGTLWFNAYVSTYATTVNKYAVVAFSAVLSADERAKMLTWGQSLYS